MKSVSAKILHRTLAMQPRWVRHFAHHSQVGKLILRMVKKIQRWLSDSPIEKENLRKQSLYAAKNKKKYMIITAISYPFGGAESYLLQTMKQATENNYQSIWLSFQNKYNQLYASDTIEQNDFGIIYKISGGYHREKIENIIQMWNPDVIHTHGPHADSICEIAIELRIPTILGYHFWGGLVKLNNDCNSDILENIKKHAIDPTYLKFKNKGITQYIASDFMNDVISSFNYPKIEQVIYPTTDDAFFKINQYNFNAAYITVVNIHRIKGGEIVLELIKEIDLPFLVIQTEPASQELDKRIEQAIHQNGKSLYLHNQTDMKKIYSISRMILIPTLVDETFCRVAYEAAANGIPLLTTGKGFIQYMIDLPETRVTHVNDWKNKVIELYHDEQKRLRLSQLLINQVARFKTADDRLMQLINQLTTRKNIMIITPWSDQGLGIQSRTYSQLLMSKGYNVYIFAYLPYRCVDTNTNLQKDSNEWKSYTDIYYSFNTREEITDREIRQFVYKYNINTCLFPEICFSRTFEMSHLLKNLNVKVYAIPNVEIVIKNEIKQFTCFHKILSPSYILMEKFKKYDFNIDYIGHGVKDYTCEKTVTNELHFLHISGLNSIERKQTLKIIDAFNFAVAKNDNITLTITIEGNIPTEIYQRCKDNKKIVLIDKHLSHQEILDLYVNSHVSIQVSSHEGIGLGFYESISCSTPVISLNTSPHNEVVKENITGWLIDCHYSPLCDNTDSLVEYAHFHINDLSEKIISLSNNIEAINTMIKNTTTYFRENCTDTILLERLEKSF